MNSSNNSFSISSANVGGFREPAGQEEALVPRDQEGGDPRTARRARLM